MTEATTDEVQDHSSIEDENKIKNEENIVPSYTIVPLDSSEITNTTSVSFLSSQSVDDMVLNIINQNNELSYDNVENSSSDVTSNNNLTILATNSIIINGYHDHETSASNKLATASSTQTSKSDEITNYSRELDLNEKIIQDGLQKMMGQCAQPEQQLGDTFVGSDNSVSPNFFNDTSISSDLFALSDKVVPIESEKISNDNSGSIGQLEAVELAIASEEELPSPWIDVMALATSPSLRTQSWDELNAFPTAVHSLVDLAGPEPYPLELEQETRSAETLAKLDTVDARSSGCCSTGNKSKANVEIVPTNRLETLKSILPTTAKENKSDCKSKKSRNVLQEITAEADICKCTDCKCDNQRNCQNCNSSVNSEEVPKKVTSDNHEDANKRATQNCQVKTVDEFISCLQTECLCNSGPGGCGSCCVVICLKNLQQLQRILTENCCTGSQTLICN